MHVLRPSRVPHQGRGVHAQSGKVRLVVADRLSLLRDGTRALLSTEEDITVVGCAENHDVLNEMAAKCRPDIVILDLGFTDADGEPSYQGLLKRPGAPRVLGICHSGHGREAVRGIEAGLSGCILPETPGSTLAEAVRAVADGELFLAVESAARFSTCLRERLRGPDLTNREMDVLRLLASGLTNAGIGQRLHIGPTTVKSHLARVYDKLGVSDRTSAVTRAMRLGLLPHP